MSATIRRPLSLCQPSGVFWSQDNNPEHALDPLPGSTRTSSRRENQSFHLSTWAPCELQHPVLSRLRAWHFAGDRGGQGRRTARRNRAGAPVQVQEAGTERVTAVPRGAAETFRAPEGTSLQREGGNPLRGYVSWLLASGRWLVFQAERSGRAVRAKGPAVPSPPGVRALRWGRGERLEGTSRRRRVPGSGQGLAPHRRIACFFFFNRSIVDTVLY